MADKHNLHAPVADQCLYNALSREGVEKEFLVRYPCLIGHLRCASADLVPNKFSSMYSTDMATEPPSTALSLDHSLLVFASPPSFHLVNSSTFLYQENTTREQSLPPPVSPPTPTSHSSKLPLTLYKPKKARPRSQRSSRSRRLQRRSSMEQLRLSSLLRGWRTTRMCAIVFACCTVIS